MITSYRFDSKTIIGIILMIVVLAIAVMIPHSSHGAISQAPPEIAPLIGVAIPEYGADAYANDNSQWQAALNDAPATTHAGWIEMVINLVQPDGAVPVVATTNRTVTPEHFREGIVAAHRRGLKIAVEPFVSVLNPTPGNDHWVGAIEYDTQQQYAQWFESYWAAVEPYLQIAQDTGVEQFTVAMELDRIEAGADPDLWSRFLLRARNQYHGRLTYNVNFDNVIVYANGSRSMPSFFFAPTLLDAIGVSAFFPLSDSPQPPRLDDVPKLWVANAQTFIDAFARAIPLPVMLTEVGFRDSSDAIYLPYQHSSSAPPDPALQQAALDAVLDHGYHDTLIAGIFVWGWDVEQFGVNTTPAGTQTLPAWVARWAERPTPSPPPLASQAFSGAP